MFINGHPSINFGQWEYRLLLFWSITFNLQEMEVTLISNQQIKISIKTLLTP